MKRLRHRDPPQHLVSSRDELVVIADLISSVFSAVGPESHFWLPIGGYQDVRTQKTHDRGHAARRSFARYAIGLC